MKMEKKILNTSESQFLLQYRMQPRLFPQTFNASLFQHQQLHGTFQPVDWDNGKYVQAAAADTMASRDATKVAIDHSVASDFHDGDFDLATKMG
nr:hypothetical protein CFP56_08252 [Quercus suber]